MSKIEWTDETWNPVSGCTWNSPGCDNCYAAPMTRRLEAMGQADYAGLTTRKHFNGQVRTLEHKLSIPLRWKKPRMVFVNSMSDLFHPDVPFEFVDRVFAVMALSRQHTFQVLTKRPERMAEYLASHDVGLRWGLLVHKLNRGAMPVSGSEAVDWTRNGLPNVWIGTSVEDQQRADERIPHLLECPAAVRFLSCEPLLGPVDAHAAGWNGHNFDPDFAVEIDWVIAGGESGPNARPMHPDWVRSLRDQCVAAGVPFFFKQWGAWQDGSARGASTLNAAVLNNGRVVCPDTRAGRESVAKELRGWNEFNPVAMARVGKKDAGRLLDGREWNEFPQTEGSRNACSVT